MGSRMKRRGPRAKLRMLAVVHSTMTFKISSVLPKKSLQGGLEHEEHLLITAQPITRLIEVLLQARTRERASIGEWMMKTVRMRVKRSHTGTGGVGHLYRQLKRPLL